MAVAGRAPARSGRGDPGPGLRHRSRPGAGVPGWADNRRESEDEARWHHGLAHLAAYRQEGNDWPRHKDCDSAREHTLRAWIHTQRYTRRRGNLDPVRLKLLDDAVPGWQTGRTRGRPPQR